MKTAITSNIIIGKDLSLGFELWTFKKSDFDLIRY